MTIDTMPYQRTFACSHCSAPIDPTTESFYVKVRGVEEMDRYCSDRCVIKHSIELKKAELRGQIVSRRQSWGRSDR